MSTVGAVPLCFPSALRGFKPNAAMPNDVQCGGRPLRGSQMSLARSLSLASTSIGRGEKPQALQLLTAEEARQRFSFVPELVFAIMMSVFAKVEDLWPLLELPWVREWDGWKEASLALSSITDETAQESDVVEEYVSRCLPIGAKQQRRAFDHRLCSP